MNMHKGTNLQALRDLHKQTTKKVLLQNHIRFPILRYYFRISSICTIAYIPSISQLMPWVFQYILGQ